MQNVDTYFFDFVLCSIWFDLKVFPEGRLGDRETGGGLGSSADPDVGASVLWSVGISDSDFDRAGHRFPGEVGSEGFIR